MNAYSKVNDVLLVYSILLLLEYALNVNAHTVHTYSPHQFKSRIKGQVACYSCVSFTRDLANYRFLEIDPPSAKNISDLHDVLSKGGMRIPIYAERCAETRAGANPNFNGARISVCPNTDNEHGACVKLKGRFNGEAYVYRHCWSEMWQDARPYQRQMSERCFSDTIVQSFVNTEQNTICFCEDDLCNRSSPHYNICASIHRLCLLIFFNLYILYH
uniref:Protein quiver n=1 Tax=Parascaris univalens TaxID=6257 RepID=A0A915B1G4_PARUN